MFDIPDCRYNAYVGELHIHTRFSDGARTDPVHLLQYAAQHGYDFIGIAEHDNVEGAQFTRDLAMRYETDVTVLRGSEISSDIGHVMALGIERNPAGHRIDTLAAEIRAQGGLVLPTHPVAGNPSLFSSGRFAELLDAGLIDGGEVVNVAYAFKNLGMIEFYKERLTAGRPFPSIVGGDAHSILGLGKADMIVFADDASEQALIEGIRMCRTVLRWASVVLGLPEWVRHYRSGLPAQRNLNLFDFQVTPGHVAWEEEVSLLCMVLNESSTPIDGHLVIRLRDQTRERDLTIPPGKQVFEESLLPRDLEPNGTAIVSSSFRTKTDRIDRIEGIDVDPPIEWMPHLVSTRDDDALALQVRCSNRLHKPVTAQVVFSQMWLPDTTSDRELPASMHIGARSKGTVGIRPDSDAPHEARIHATIECEGFRDEQSVWFSPQPVRAITAGTWPALDAPSFVSNETSDDGVPKVRLATGWTRATLRLHARVWCPIPYRTPAPPSVHRTEFGVLLNPFTHPVIGNRFCRIAVVPDAERRWRLEFRTGLFETPTGSADSELEVTEDRDWVVFRVAFPFSLLEPFMAFPGQNLRLAAGIRYVDEKGSAGFLEWFSDVFHRHHAENWGIIMLA